MSDHYDYMPGVRERASVTDHASYMPGNSTAQSGSEDPSVAGEDSGAGVRVPQGVGPDDAVDCNTAVHDAAGRERRPDVADDVIEDTSVEKAISRFANLISWIFVPLLMPVYGIILIFSLSFLSMTTFNTKLVFTLIVFGANFLVPMLAVLLLKKMGLVEDVGLNGRKERLIPYIISILCLLGTGFFLYMKSAPLWVAMFFAGGALAAVINLIVNFKWKISAHAAGIAGIVAMLIQIMKEGVPSGGITWWIVGSIIMAGLLGSARIWLGRHTLLQVLAGTAVGFMSVWTLSLL